MNERIQKLAEQQGLTGPNYFLSSQELEKFAELIIRECADIASINQHQYEPTGLYVLKHFGVEAKLWPFY